MQLYKFLSAFLLASPTLASPLLTLLTPRACSHIYSPNLWSISQHVPETANGPFTTPFSVSQDIGKRDLIAAFNIPAGAYGCQLEFDYQPNPSASVTGLGDPQLLNVFALSSAALPATVTWDSIAPVTGSLVGTWSFPTGADLGVQKTIVVASFACQPTMNFRFQTANEGAKGAVSDPEDGASGLRITYNC